MGGKQTLNKKFAEFVGEKKEGETAVLTNCFVKQKILAPKTMLQELQ